MRVENYTVLPDILIYPNNKGHVGHKSKRVICMHKPDFGVAQKTNGVGASQSDEWFRSDRWNKNYIVHTSNAYLKIQNV